MRKLTSILLLIVICCSFKKEGSRDYVEPLNIDLAHLEDVFLHKINQVRKRRRAPDLIKDEAWDNAAASTFKKCYRYKFNSNPSSMHKRMRKHFKKHKKEFNPIEKLALYGAAEYSSMKLAKGRYYLDKDRDADFPFFYGFKSDYKDGSEHPTPIGKKTYDDLADQLIKQVNSYNSGDVYRKTITKIGLKFGLSKQRKRMKVPNVKVIVFLGCNSMGAIVL